MTDPKAASHGSRLRSAIFVILGMWMAVKLHKDFWIWAPILSFVALVAFHLVWIGYIIIAFYFKWRKESHD